MVLIDSAIMAGSDVGIRFLFPRDDFSPILDSVREMEIAGHVCTTDSVEGVTTDYFTVFVGQGCLAYGFSADAYVVLDLGGFVRCSSAIQF